MRIAKPVAMGAAATIIGMVGLVVASKTQGAILYWTGLGLFVVCVLFVFYQIAKNVGASDGSTT